MRDVRVLYEVNRLFFTGEEREARFSNKKAVVNYLCGYRAFLITFLKGQDGQAPHKRLLERKIRNLEALIDQCQKWWFDIL